MSKIVPYTPARICIAPGPCAPAQAGISVELIQYFAGKVPILGVCLGHQAIGAAYGGKIVGAKQIMHGKTSDSTHNGTDVLTGLPSPYCLPRYQSLVFERETHPD